MHHLIPTAIIPSVQTAPLTVAAVRREFRALLDAGAELRVSGRATLRQMLTRAYTPRARLDLFDTRYYLSALRQNPDLRFFVAYVIPPAKGRVIAFARIFYKDVSLIWRSASHVIRSEYENWIGKGDVTVVTKDGYDLITSAEETTDLPLELQDALEALSRAQARVTIDHEATTLVLRNAPDDRIRPYRDFSAPRERAANNPRNRINGGRRIAWFTRKGDPATLRFAAGYAPDFKNGIIQVTHSDSNLYGGALTRYRIASPNRKLQYLFFAGPRHVWIIPPQATTTELMSFGVRTIGVALDDDLCVPGYEYHYLDETEDPPVWVSQIPRGYVGPASTIDPARADASAWLDALPVVQEFRRLVIGTQRRRRGSSRHAVGYQEASAPTTMRDGR